MTPAQQPTIDPALADEARAAGSPVLPLSPAGASKTTAQPSPAPLDHSAPSGVPLAASQPVPAAQDPAPPAVLAAAGANDTTPPAVLAPAGGKDSDPDAYFCTAHLTSDLKRRTVRGGAVTLSAQGVKFGLKLGSTAILARLLTPADFGLIAMVTVVTGFVEMFKDAGLSTATVQRERITHAQVSTLFWINVALSALIMCVIAAMAPAIAWFYGDARLLPVTLALSGTMIFGGLAVQHQALLRRKMQFGRLAVIEIASMTAGIAAAVAMAWFGFTYWSLVGMTAATAATTALLSFTLSGWIPGLPVRGSGVMPMLKFGSNLAGYQMINHLSRNADNFAIGWWWGPGVLGIYSRSYALLFLPWYQVLAPLHGVVLPGLCRLTTDELTFRTYYRRSLSVVAWLSFGIIGVCCIYVNELVSIVMGPAWSGVVPLFLLLSPTAAIMSVRAATVWVYSSVGEMGRQLRYGAISAIVLVVAILSACPFGPEWVAIAVSVVQIVQFLVSVPVCFSRTFMRLSDPMIALAPATVVALLIFGGVGVMRTQVPTVHPTVWLAAVFVYAAVAAAHMVIEYRKVGWHT